jgi:hypothetical protein
VQISQGAHTVYRNDRADKQEQDRTEMAVNFPRVEGATTELASLGLISI